MNLVIYGAGACAYMALEKCRTKYPDATIVFADSDPARVGHEIDGVPILSRDGVQDAFGKGFSVFVSPLEPVRGEIVKDLLNTHFVEEAQILNVQETRKYLSCWSLESFAIVTDTGICSCCSLEKIHNKAPFVLWHESIEQTVNDFLDQRDRFIDALQDDMQDCPCKNCPELSMREWASVRKVRELDFYLSYPCQLSCEYCGVLSNAKHLKENQDLVKSAGNVDLREVIRCFRKRDQLSLQSPVVFASGEITLAPHKEEILSLMEEFPVQIFSNGILYDEKIAKLIARPGSFLNVSIDSGTRETYRKVKGLDAFDQVVSTLRKYVSGGGNNFLKIYSFARKSWKKRSRWISGVGKGASSAKNLYFSRRDSRSRRNRRFRCRRSHLPRTCMPRTGNRL